MNAESIKFCNFKPPLLSHVMWHEIRKVLESERVAQDKKNLTLNTPLEKENQK